MSADRLRADRRRPVQMRGEPTWHKARRTRCQRCAGKGWYRGGYPLRVVNPCPVCNGSGHVD